MQIGNTVHGLVQVNLLFVVDVRGIKLNKDYYIFYYTNENAYGSTHVHLCKAVYDQ